MTNLFVQETWINSTKGYCVGESDVYETYTDNTSELFKAMQKEYGRCAGKVYIGDGQRVGWVFEKRQKYTDCNEYYLQETWVTVHKARPQKTISYDYADF